MSERDDELGALIKSKATHHAAPVQLRARIGAMLAQEGIGLTVRQPSARARPAELWRRWMSMVGFWWKWNPPWLCKSRRNVR